MAWLGSLRLLSVCRTAISGRLWHTWQVEKIRAGRRQVYTEQLDGRQDAQRLSFLQLHDGDEIYVANGSAEHAALVLLLDKLENTVLLTVHVPIQSLNDSVDSAAAGAAAHTTIEISADQRVGSIELATLIAHESGLALNSFRLHHRVSRAAVESWSELQFTDEYTIAELGLVNRSVLLVEPGDPLPLHHVRYKFKLLESPTHELVTLFEMPMEEDCMVHEVKAMIVRKVEGLVSDGMDLSLSEPDPRKDAQISAFYQQQLATLQRLSLKAHPTFSLNGTDALMLELEKLGNKLRQLVEYATPHIRLQVLNAHDRLGTVLVDDQTLAAHKRVMRDMVDAKVIVVRRLEEAEPKKQLDQLVVGVRRWHPSKFELDHEEDLIVEAHWSVAQLRDELAYMLNVPREQIALAKMYDPDRGHALDVLELEWDPESGSEEYGSGMHTHSELRSWPFYLSDGHTLVVKDKREALKQLTREERRRLELDRQSVYGKPEEVGVKFHCS